MKTLLVTTDSKLTRNLFESGFPKSSDVIIVVDKCSDFRRTFKVVFKSLISRTVLLKMAIANFRRRRGKRIIADHEVYDHTELLTLFKKYNPDRMILFRAGLILKRRMFPEDACIVNIHCAKLPGYGGLGAVAKALEEKEYAQYATLHMVTDRIDGGSVLMTKQYLLDPKLSYLENENRAYDAGYSLLCDILVQSEKR